MSETCVVPRGDGIMAMAANAPLSSGDRALLVDTPYAACDDLAAAGRLLAGVVPRRERSIGPLTDPGQSGPALSAETVRSLSELVKVDQFYRGNAHYLAQLGEHGFGARFDHSFLKRSHRGDTTKAMFSGNGIWYFSDVRRFVISITTSSIHAVLLCVQKLLVVLLKVHGSLRDYDDPDAMRRLVEELKQSQRLLCRSLLENAVDARGVHPLLRERAIAVVERAIEKAMIETLALEKASQLSGDLSYQTAAAALTRDVAVFHGAAAPTRDHNRRVPTTRLTPAELEQVIATGRAHPWSRRSIYRTDPVDWLWDHYRQWVGHGLLQSDIKNADQNFYYALKRRAARAAVPDWFILPSKGEITEQNADDRGESEKYSALKAVGRLRNRLYRQGLQTS